MSNNVKNEQVVANNQAATPGEGQVQQTTQEIPAVMYVQQLPQQQPAEPPKENWFKKHWKMLLAGASAVAAVAGSGVLAYQKGKNAGSAQCMQPMNDYNDNSLNPNI